MPEDGTAQGSLVYTAVDQVTRGPHTAAGLRNRQAN